MKAPWALTANATVVSSPRSALVTVPTLLTPLPPAVFFKYRCYSRLIHVPDFTFIKRMSWKYFGNFVVKAFRVFFIKTCDSCQTRRFGLPQRKIFVSFEEVRKSVCASDSLLSPWRRNSNILYCTQICRCSDLFRSKSKHNVAGSHYVTLQNVFFMHSKNLPRFGISGSHLSRSSAVNALLLSRLFSDKSSQGGIMSVKSSSDISSIVPLLSFTIFAASSITSSSVEPFAVLHL